MIDASVNQHGQISVTPSERKSPVLIERYERPLRKVVSTAPAIYMFFQPERVASCFTCTRCRPTAGARQQVAISSSHQCRSFQEARRLTSWAEMKTHVWLFAAAALLSVAYPGRLEGQQAATDWRAVAAKIVERMALVRGERVLLVAASTTGITDSLVAPLRAAVRAARGTDLGVLAGGETPREWETDFSRAARALTGAVLDAHLAPVDIAVMLPGALPSDMAYVAMQRILRSGRARTIHFHWSGAYTMDAAPLPVTPEIARAYEQAVLKTNYTALARAQRKLERAMRTRVVRVTTPAGTDLQFKTGNRQVTKQDGDASAARA
ncbi:MAG: hypothetical protein ABR543_19415, partial [Gemmatimonadaceae bacterium]